MQLPDLKNSESDFLDFNFESKVTDEGLSGTVYTALAYLTNWLSGVGLVPLNVSGIAL